MITLLALFALVSGITLYEIKKMDFYTSYDFFREMDLNVFYI